MHTFSVWLHRNVLAAQGALLQALVRKDHLQFVEAPRIRQEYMEKIGGKEAEALEKELEAELLIRKKKLIQSCLNRREAIDMEAIDAQIAREREELLKRAGLGQVTDPPRLSPEEEEKLQTLYRELVKTFHPSVRPDLTDAQKALFDKAVEAYQHQDLTMLSVISEMLKGEQMPLLLSFRLELDGGADPAEEARQMAAVLSEDYTLAAEIYPCFSMLQEEKILQETAQSDLRQCEAVLETIEKMLLQFPFSARATLADEEKCDAYLRQVRGRIAQADAEINRLEREITAMTGGEPL